MSDGRTDNRALDAIVNEVVAEAHVSRDLILPEEIEYIRSHVLKKPLKVIHIWALGVGLVITGLYFGWNFGLPVGGPIGVLVASLFVWVLYLAWYSLFPNYPWRCLLRTVRSRMGGAHRGNGSAS
jgi:amino acid permease